VYPLRRVSREREGMVPNSSPTPEESATTSPRSVNRRVPARTRWSLVGLLSIILVVATATAVLSATNSGPTHPENVLSLPVDAAAQVTMNQKASSCWSADECVLTTTLSPGNVPALYFTSGSRVVRSEAALPTYLGRHVTVAGVWCKRIADCWAAGTVSVGPSKYAVTARLLGNTWKTSPVVLPSSAAGGQTTESTVPGAFGVPVTAAFNGLSCASETSCVAVGTYKASKLTTLGLVAIYDGSTWLSQEAPLPSNANFGPSTNPDNSANAPTTSLTGVSCGDTQNCVIIGSYTSATMPSWASSIPLIVEDHRSTLTARSAPLPYSSILQDQEKLTSVACVGSVWCTIVDAASSNFLNTDGQFGVVRTSDGWRAHVLSGATPQATQALRSLGAGSSPIVCWQVEHCAMTGGYDASTILQLHGTTVTSVENIPTWSGRGDSLSGTFLGSRLNASYSTGTFGNLSCSSARSCASFSVSDDGSFRGRPTFFFQSQGLWHGAVIPVAGVPSGRAHSGLQGVSCSTFGCVAVGNYERATGTHPWASLFAHGRWSSEFVPLPQDASTGQSASLESVSCIRTGACLAVGYFWTRDGLMVPLAERRHDGRWSPTAALGSWAVPRSATSAILQRNLAVQPLGVVLFTVRCVSMDRCFAGGVDYYSAKTPPLFFFDGTTWSRIAVTLPKGAVPSRGELYGTWHYEPPYVSGIDCSTSPNECVFVGGYATAGEDRVWEASGRGATPIHANDLFALSRQVATSGAVTSIACTRSDCVAPVGLVSNSQNIAPAYFVRHHGVWSFHVERGLRSTLLSDVTCPGFAPCQIIGQRDHGLVARLTLDGSEPQLTRVTSLSQFSVWIRPGYRQAWDLPAAASISCAPAGYCAIVGTQGSSALASVLAPR